MNISRARLFIAKSTGSLPRSLGRLVMRKFALMATLKFAVAGITALVLICWVDCSLAYSTELPALSANVSVDAFEGNPLADPGASAPPDSLPLNVSITNDYGSAVASVLGGTDPSVSVSASTGGNDTGASANASLLYSFEVSGPGAATQSSETIASNSTVIPVASVDGFGVGQYVDIAGAGTDGATLTATITKIDPTQNTLTIDTPTSSEIGSGKTVATAVEVVFTGDNSASSAITTNPGPEGARAGASSTLTDSQGNTIFNSPVVGAYDTTFYLDLGSIYNIDLQAFALVGSAGDTFAASALADPTLTIGGPHSTDYSIAYSAGLVGSKSTVPEPSTLAMLATVCTVLWPGVWMWRKRNSTS